MVSKRDIAPQEIRSPLALPGRAHEGEHIPQLGYDREINKFETVVISIDNSTSMGPRAFVSVFRELSSLVKDFSRYFSDVDVYSFLWAGSAAVGRGGKKMSSLVRRFRGLNQKTLDSILHLSSSTMVRTSTNITDSHYHLFKFRPSLADADLMIVLTDAGQNEQENHLPFTKLRFREMSAMGRLIWGLVPIKGKYNYNYIRKLIDPSAINRSVMRLTKRG